MDSLRKKQPTQKQIPQNLANDDLQSYIDPPFHTSENETNFNDYIYEETQSPESPLSHIDTNAVEKKFERGNKIRKLLFVSFFVILVLILSAGAFLLIKTHGISKKVSLDPQKHSFTSDIRSMVSTIAQSDYQPLKGESDGRINILLLGAAGEKKPGKNLTDTIMIMSVNTKDNKVAFLSLPRDLYVNIPDSNSYTKINGIYQYGLKNGNGAALIKKTVENVTGITMHYFVVADFDGFTKIIDDIGGINVMVERDIYDPRYPGPNYSYETFEIKKGLHTLDGETALKYVRERHDDPEGDFGRAKRQQQVLQSVKNKLFSMQTFFNVVAINKMLNTVGDNIKTDVSLEDINGFIQLSKKLDTQNVNNVVVDAWKKESLLKVSHVTLGNARAFILIPRVGNYSEIHEQAANIFNHESTIKRKKAMTDEKATIAIINESGDFALMPKIKKLLTDSLSISNIITQTNSISRRSHTAVIDATGGKKIYTLDELLKKLPATLSTEDSDIKTSADLTIVLGSDLSNIYKYEEDSIEDFNSAQDNQEFFEPLIQ